MLNQNKASTIGKERENTFVHVEQRDKKLIVDSC